MFRSAFIAAAVVTTFQAAKSGAQVSDSLKAALGAPIRLQTVSEPGWIRGTVTSVSKSAVTLQGAHGLCPINMADIVSADRFNGQPRGKGAVVGLVLGGIAGAFVGGKISAANDRGPESGLGGPVGVLEGVAIGVPLGAVVGFIATPAQWQVLVPNR